MTPSISVIIPTYNRAPYVLQAVHSILAQSITDCEVIVVDDGSTDATRAALEHLIDDKKVRYCYQSNSGRSTARNKGLEIARAQWIMFLDSDDVLRPNALQSLYDAACERSSAGLIVGRVENVNAAGSVIWKQPPWPRGLFTGCASAALVREATILMGTYIARRDLFESNVRFDPHVEPCEDYDLHVRLALKCDVYCIEDYVAQIRRHDGNTEHATHREGAIRAMRKHLSLIDQWSSLPFSVRCYMKSDLLLNLADSHYALDRRLTAFGYYSKAVVASPTRALTQRTFRQLGASLIPAVLKNFVSSRSQSYKVSLLAVMATLV